MLTIKATITNPKLRTGDNKEFQGNSENHLVGAVKRWASNSLCKLEITKNGKKSVQYINLKK